MDEPKLFPKDAPDPEEHVKKQQEQGDAYSKVSKNVTTLGSRLRVLEEQYSNIRKKSQLSEGNFIELRKEVRQEVKSFSEDVLELKRMVNDLQEKIGTVSSELDSAVKEHDFKVVEKYVDLWNPARFVTKKELKEAIEGLKDEEE